MHQRGCRSWLLVSALAGGLLGAVLWPGAALAQDAESIRREVEAMRQQFDAMRQQYERKLQELTDRLQTLETQKAAPAPTPAPAPAAPEAAPAPATPSIVDVLRPRQPLTLLPQPGRPLLFDIGVSGDFVADFTGRRIDRNDAGTFAGRENRLFPREVSLGVFGRVDPYASAAFRITAEEEAPEDGAEAEVAVILEEANVTLLTLPLLTNLRFGVMRPRFGTFNVVHGDDLPQVDRPNVLARFFGEEQMVGEKGVDATWILPTPFYQELVLGAFTGDNETAFGSRSLREPLVAGRLRSFFELGDGGALQLDLSGARGETDEDRRNALAGIGLKYKWSPLVGYAFPVITLAGEAIHGNRTTRLTPEEVDELVAEGADPESIRLTERFERWGYYVYGQYDWSRRWAGGLRYDWTELPIEDGREWAISPYLQFKPSEFLRFRVQYKRSDGTRAVDREANELFIQGTFILGAHPIERF